MQQIVYYVAVSLDGFITGPHEDISMYAQSGEGVLQYISDLQSFQTVIMGRKTYEFGYQYGLIPGQPAYPQMDHYIFSNSMVLDQCHDKVNVCKLDKKAILDLKKSSSTDIYLCGGGSFAAWLMNHGLLDVVKLKINPIVTGGGVPLFQGLNQGYRLEPIDRQIFDGNFDLITYKIID